MKAPAVTVLIAVYNGADCLREAVDSILSQTLADFELLVVDDASVDATSQILREYAQKDSRLRILRNDVNLERCVSRNRGIEAARSDLIAVMDADDIADPERLEKQVAFMRANPHITVCGSALSILGTQVEIWRPPLEHGAIRSKLLFESCLYHPAILYRKKAVSCIGGYDVAMPLAEDYDVWARFSMLPAFRFANLPDILCRYRLSQTDAKYHERLQSFANLVRKKLLRHIGLTPSDEEFSAHLALSLYRRDLSCAEILACGRWLGKLRKAAIGAEPPYDAHSLKDELEYRWYLLCRNNMTAAALGLIYLCSGFASWKYIVGGSKIILKKIWQNMGRKIVWRRF